MRLPPVISYIGPKRYLSIPQWFKWPFPNSFFASPHLPWCTIFGHTYMVGILEDIEKITSHFQSKQKSFRKFPRSHIQHTDTITHWKRLFPKRRPTSPVFGMWIKDKHDFNGSSTIRVCNKDEEEFSSALAHMKAPKKMHNVGTLRRHMKAV